MLNETKLACRVTATAYDLELVGLIQAAAKDLQIAGVKLNGVIAFTVSTTQAGTTITDSCTVTDALVIRAIITYVRAHFGTPVDYDKLVESYDMQKAQLMYATGYTDYGESEPNGGDEDDEE